MIKRGERREMIVDGEKGVTREEIVRVLKKAKNGKTVGGNRIPAEVWKYGRERMINWVWGICARMWRGEDWIED